MNEITTPHTNLLVWGLVMTRIQTSSDLDQKVLDIPIIINIIFALEV